MQNVICHVKPKSLTLTWTQRKLRASRGPTKTVEAGFHQGRFPTARFASGHNNLAKR